VKEALGEGAFGKVELVADKKTGKRYALKAVKKSFMIEHGKIRHVLREK